MEPVEKLRIDFCIEFDHCAQATLQSSSGSFVCKCLDDNDGLDLLARQAAGILSYPRSHAVAIWEMNGQTWWVLERRDDRIDLNVVEFRETEQELPGANSVTTYVFERSAFFVSLGFNEFVRELTRAFEAIEQPRVFEGFEFLGAQTYKAAWRYEFPEESVSRLRQFLSKS